MEKLSHLFSYYVLFLGILLVLLSIIECFIPAKSYSFWKKWIHHPLYPLHGIILTLGGLPLTFFRDGISGKIMMGIGIFLVITGPFIFLFPGRMRAFFTTTESEIGEEDRAHLVYFDAIIRGLSGLLFLYVIYQYRHLF
jgi:hypothetical protein